MKEIEINIKKEDFKKKLGIKDGYTPIKGKDYFDGEKGDPGKNGKSIKGKDGSDGSPDTGIDIVKKLSVLEKDDRLSYNVLKDLPTIFKSKSVSNEKLAGTGYLREITDVAFNNLQNGQVIKYNSITKLWENSTDTADLSAYSTTAQADLLYVPYTGATASVELGSQEIQWNNGSGIIAIGGADAGLLMIYGASTVSALLDVNSLTTTDKTFTFPDHTGNILVDGADVDLGAFGLTVQDFKSTNSFQMWNGSSIELYSDAGITQTGAIISQGASLFLFGDGSGTTEAILDFSGVITTPKTFTFPNKSGTFAMLDDIGGGSGTVTSVSMTVPTGLSISGSPITVSGTLALTLTTGYAIPTTTQLASYVTGTPWTGMGYLTSVTAHNLLSATHGDTLTDTVVAGDIMIGNATPKWSRLAKGTDGYVLTIDPTTHLPVWAAGGGGGSQTPWTANVNADGYTLFGNDGSGETLTLGSTSHATKGKILFGTSAYDEVNNRLGLGITTPTTDIAFGGLADRTMQVERQTVSSSPQLGHGKDLILIAGGAMAGQTDKAGGDLILSAGISTGHAASSNIYFQTAPDGVSGSTDRTPINRMQIDANGSILLLDPTASGAGTLYGPNYNWSISPGGFFGGTSQYSTSADNVNGYQAYNFIQQFINNNSSVYGYSGDMYLMSGDVLHVQDGILTGYN